jgi:hypothetical protein
VIVHCAGDIALKGAYPPRWVEVCERELEQLSAMFDQWLPSRVTIRVFASYEAIAAAYGKPNGLAFIAENAIAIVADYYVVESLRHELMHLLSARLGSLYPALKSEGLAVWAQKTCWGRTADGYARWYLRRSPISLAALLDERAFRAKEHVHRNYCLAGSFTDFLIRRFGWSRYKRFFAESASAKHFRATFERSFGVTLEEAERQWHREIL